MFFFRNELFPVLLSNAYIVSGWFFTTKESTEFAMAIILLVVSIFLIKFLDLFINRTCGRDESCF